MGNELYTQMSDDSRLQDLWKIPKVGDEIYDRLLKTVMTVTEVWSNGEIHYGGAFTSRTDEVISLPSSDDLIKMLMETKEKESGRGYPMYDGEDELLWAFSKWSENNALFLGRTIKQLWLMFLFSELWGATWDNEKGEWR